ncbi:MAG: hypothetical protein ABSA83_09310 [Verrucomicrobiota bacterium]|jgi:molecular chaperone DnaK (HSP70)
MNISGQLTTVVDVTGTASVARVQYDMAAGTIIVILTIQPEAGKARQIQQTISGADVTALGANWSDTDLLNWFVTKFGLTNVDTQTTPAAIVQEQTLEQQAASAIAAAGGVATAAAAPAPAPAPAV